MYYMEAEVNLSEITSKKTQEKFRGETELKNMFHIYICK